MSNLFRNSSPGALTREQAVELQKKRFAERRLQQSQNPTASLSPNSFGFGGANQPNAFGAENAEPSTPSSGSSAPKSDNSSLDGALSGMSKYDLERLKIALNDASSKTTAFGIVVGPLLFFLNPASAVATVTAGGLALAVVAFNYLENKIDEYLLKQENTEGHR